MLFVTNYQSFQSRAFVRDHFCDNDSSLLSPDSHSPVMSVPSHTDIFNDYVCL